MSAAAVTHPATRPAWLPVDPAGIPHELTDRAAWYPAIIKPKAGKVGKWDKIPGDPATGRPAKWSDAATRCTFGAAFMAYESGRFPGVGYMMDADAGVIGIDVDDAFTDDGALKPHAREIVDAFPGAYWERSISGKGLRGFCKGSLPVGGCRDKIDGCSVELYADVRFLTITGQALQPVDVLPTLQGAVDWLHARLTAGRVRATGTAVATGMTGRNADPSPEVFAIVEDLMGGPHAARLSEIWGRDDLHAAGASEQDWALEKEAVKTAMARGHAGDTLARIVEEVIRAGPYRVKWDEKRGSATWLAQDIANAIETVKEERKKVAEPVFEEDAAAADPLGTPEQIIARLERELARERARSATQQTIIRGQQDRLEILEGIVHTIDDVLGRPDDELSADDKIVAIGGTRWLHAYRSKKLANDERPTVSLRYLAKVVGLPDRRVSKSLDRLSSSDEAAGAPFRKYVTRRPVVDEDGGTRWESTMEVIPWHERGAETLRATATYATPARPKHGGSKAASDVRWGRCPKRCDSDVIVRGRCGGCGEPLGERRMRPEDFEALNVQVGHSDSSPPELWESRLGDVQVGRSAANGRGNGHDSGGGGQDLQVVDPGPEHDRAAADLVAIPLGSDRRDGDYSRSANSHSEAPRLQIDPKVDANGRVPSAPVNGNGSSALPIGPESRAEALGDGICPVHRRWLSYPEQQAGRCSSCHPPDPAGAPAPLEAGS